MKYIASILFSLLFVSILINLHNIEHIEVLEESNVLSSKTLKIMSKNAYEKYEFADFTE